jgi:hypothetical protein
VKNFLLFLGWFLPVPLLFYGVVAFVAWDPTWIAHVGPNERLTFLAALPFGWVLELSVLSL